MPSLIARLIAGIALPFLFISCAAPAPQPEEGPRVIRRLPTDAEVEQYNAMVEPVDRIMCREETKTGTNIPARKCWLVKDLQDVSRFHREQLRNVLR